MPLEIAFSSIPKFLIAQSRSVAIELDDVDDLTGAVVDDANLTIPAEIFAAVYGLDFDGVVLPMVHLELVMSQSSFWSVSRFDEVTIPQSSSLSKAFLNRLSEISGRQVHWLIQSVEPRLHPLRAKAERPGSSRHWMELPSSKV